MEKTLVLIKPDAFGNGHTGDILQIYEKEGFRIAAMKLMQMDKKIAAKHYAEHVGKPFYDGLVEFMTSGPIVAMVLEGENVIQRVRDLNGKTNPKDAAEGTIRKRFAEDGRRNAVHASDSLESAEREIHVFFNETELYA